MRRGGGGPQGLQGTDAGLLLLHHPAAPVRDPVYLGTADSVCIWRPERKGVIINDPIKMDQDESQGRFWLITCMIRSIFSSIRNYFCLLLLFPETSYKLNG